MRAGFLYLLLYGATGILTEVPGLAWLAERYQAIWDPFVQRLGAALLGIEVPDRLANGSGDQLIHYVEAFAHLLVALVVAVAWSLADRRRVADRPVVELARIYLRYLLAYTMLLYGMVKVLKSQFPEPAPGRLLVPLGQMSPMGLLWTFMGRSTAYTVFAGLAEVTGGALLLFRRTTALGALVLVGVLGNVVALNYCYDVPVKLFSTHLLVMALVLLAPDLRRIADLLVRNRATAPADLGAPPVPERWRPALPFVKGLLIAAILARIGWTSWQGYRSYGDGMERSPLQGAYQVLAMERAGRALAPGDPDAFRQLAINQFTLTVIAGDGAVRRFAMQLDAGRGVLELTDTADPERTGRLAAAASGGQLRLEGTLAGEPVSLALRRMDRGEFLLLDRGFHWVSDAPFNR